MALDIGKSCTFLLVIKMTSLTNSVQKVAYNKVLVGWGGGGGGGGSWSIMNDTSFKLYTSVASLSTLNLKVFMSCVEGGVEKTPNSKIGPSCQWLVLENNGKIISIEGIDLLYNLPLSVRKHDDILKPVKNQVVFFHCIRKVQMNF